jgi:replicative DNA helicase
MIVSSKNFYDPMHQKIFSAIEKLIYSGMLANPITLKNYFENEKDEIYVPDYLVKITKFSTSSRQAIEYSKLIYDLFVKRELIKISENVIDSAKLNDLDKDGQSIIENFEKSLFDLAEKGSFSSSLVKFDEAMKMTIEMASNAYKNDEGLVGVPTGLRDLDDRLGGLHKSDLLIIAGRPSMGKTALATNIAFHAAKKIQEDGRKSTIAFFSLEMSSEQLSTRILAEQSRIKSNDIRRGRISEEQFDKFIETSKNISELPLYIDETPAISIAALSNRARRIKRLYGLDMVVVDYIQLMRAANFREGRVQEISEITQGLKALAKELSVPVLALSQLSRAVESRDIKKPQLSDLRESGSIEQDADVVMFVYREAYYLEKLEPRPATVEHAEWQSKMNEVSNLAEIIIGKQRHGPTGNIMLEFEAMFTKFKDIQNS